jgi:hypothetical protein
MRTGSVLVRRDGTSMLDVLTTVTSLADDRQRRLLDAAARHRAARPRDRAVRFRRQPR